MTAPRLITTVVLYYIYLESDNNLICAWLLSKRTMVIVDGTLLIIRIDWPTVDDSYYLSDKMIMSVSSCV